MDQVMRRRQRPARANAATAPSTRARRAVSRLGKMRAKTCVPRADAVEDAWLISPAVGMSSVSPRGGRVVGTGTPDRAPSASPSRGPREKLAAAPTSSLSVTPAAPLKKKNDFIKCQLERLPLEDEKRQQQSGLEAAFTASLHQQHMRTMPHPFARERMPTSDEDFHVVVDGVTVFPDKKLELLGVKFESSFSTFPHEASVAASARQRAAMIARLSHHLPRGAYLQQLARGLVLGKVSYAIGAVASPRLEGDTSPPVASHRAAQIAINDVARSILGQKRTDHINVSSLFQRAGLSSRNDVTVHAVSMETWRAFHSQDGPDGSGNALGQVLFPSNVATRSTRSEAAGVVSPHLPYPSNTLVGNGIATWNKFPALLEASNRRM
eukprot:maker-scaffold1054_size66621-snap-gene-0.9 protein:Tk00474 transcript:maker-scaffold1054_size66621-snap-gene-0.9-mRNA-1 annotation:"hemolysin secretion protein d"